MISLGWTVTVTATGAPPVSATQPPLQIDALDRIEVTLAGTTGGGAPVAVGVNIQFGALSEIHAILVKSSDYSGDVSFVANDGTTTSPTSPILLTGPQLYAGGTVALLGVTPQQFVFKNAGTTPATVEVFVGRDAM